LEKKEREREGKLATALINVIRTAKHDKNKTYVCKRACLVHFTKPRFQVLIDKNFFTVPFVNETGDKKRLSFYGFMIKMSHDNFYL
jgi:hypothetical protein